MNYHLLRYYMRRLGCLKLSDITQRLLLRRFHNHHYHRLSASQATPSLDQFFPGEESSFRQLRTATGIKSARPNVIPGWIGDDAFWKEFAALYPCDVKRIIDKADAVRSYKITLFGWKEIELKSPICWSEALDPEHPGLEWPSEHYSSIDFFCHPNLARLDVKWCWELNRFQHLLHLGAAWRITRNELYALTAREHISSWIEQIQYPLGVQWSSNLEVALRMLSWARCHLMCANSASWDNEFLMRFVPCLYAHVCHVEQELTLHHTPGNHLLGEACSLIQISCIYDEFPKASRRFERSKKIVERLLPKLILSDGVYSEQSTGYLKFVLEFIASVMILMDALGKTFEDQVSERVKAALDYIWQVSPDLRNIPMIGDCDSGSAIGWRLSDYWDYEPLVLALCTLLHKPEPIGHAQTFHPESFLIVGETGLNAFLSMKEKHFPKAPRQPLAQNFSEFPQGGYQVSRDSRLHMVLDGGPLGIYPGYGHGHADGLSFVLSIDGSPFLVDPGTMVYNGAPYWRNYFRGASSHNTVRFDGNDPTVPIAPFLWSNPVDTRLQDSLIGEGWRLLKARQKTGAIVHTRYIVHWYERGIIVGDLIQGQGVHVVEWFLHFAPECVVAQVDDGTYTSYTKKTLVEMQFYGYENAVFHNYLGSMEPIRGWYSQGYGRLEPCTSLQVRYQVALPVSTLFVVHFSDLFLRIPPELAEPFSRWENMPL